MKRLVPFILILSILCGCSVWGRRTYVSVQPHDAGYEVAVDSDAITVSSYLGLKAAILDFVAEGTDDGVIRVESYSGEITKDLESAVYEIWRNDPLGAYAVDFMTYDCSKIANQYEIHIHNTFRRSEQQLASIINAADMDAVQLRIVDAMGEYAPTLTLRVGEYQDFDPQSMAKQILESHPEFALELPVVTMMTYPESGSQRILELSFEYTLPQETMEQYRTEATERLALISQLYGSNNDQALSSRRFFDRVRRDGVLLSSQGDEPFLNSSVYSAIVKNEATSLGYAQTYCLLMESRDIPCSVIEGTFMGQKHYWCSFILKEQTYYADPSPIMNDSSIEPYMLTEDELPAYGYEIQ